MEGVEWHAQSEALLKDWLLKRNCALSPRQFGAFYLSLVILSSLIALSFALRGAWLVLPFAGLELIGLGAAFVVYARHAVDYEYIRLAPHCLVVECMCAQRLTHFEFNPRWVRVEPAGPHGWVQLHSSGKSLAIGRHVPLSRRRQFADELRMWLRHCA